MIFRSNSLHVNHVLHRNNALYDTEHKMIPLLKFWFRLT